jgi:hypothetical protein
VVRREPRRTWRHSVRTGAAIVSGVATPRNARPGGLGRGGSVGLNAGLRAGFGPAGPQAQRPSVLQASGSWATESDKLATPATSAEPVESAKFTKAPAWNYLRIITQPDATSPGDGDLGRSHGLLRSRFEPRSVHPAPAPRTPLVSASRDGLPQLLGSRWNG